MTQAGGRSSGHGAVEVRYRAGDHVRVSSWDPPGHLRTPWYVRGHVGVIERYCGSFGNPEELAFGRDGLPALPLYRVRFRQQDIWTAYAGGSEDTLDLEIYQHWLEPEIASAGERS